MIILQGFWQQTGEPIRYLKTPTSCKDKYFKKLVTFDKLFHSKIQNKTAKKMLVLVSRIKVGTSIAIIRPFHIS